VTLTLKHTRAPLRQQLDFLRASFRRLRQRKCWKACTYYGYGTIEITFNAHTQEWHPHLHILVNSDFIPKPAIKKAWESITRGSYIVDIRPVKSVAGVAEYITSYIAKPPPIETFDEPNLLIEYYQAIYYGRLMIQFGKKRPPLPARVDDGYPNDWLPKRTLNSVLADASRGDQASIAILAQVGRYLEPWGESDSDPPAYVGRVVQPRKYYAF